MKVLGIDPGFGRCGVAIINKPSGGKETLIYSDCIETSREDAFEERLAVVADVCSHLINEHNPNCVVLEKLFFTTNQKTAMRVAEVRGAILNTAIVANVPVYEYTPMQVKSAVAGDGRADKRQISRMLHMLIRIDKKIRYDDEYDAIAIGITHLAMVR